MSRRISTLVKRGVESCRRVSLTNWLLMGILASMLILASEIGAIRHYSANVRYLTEQISDHTFRHISETADRMREDVKQRNAYKLAHKREMEKLQNLPPLSQEDNLFRDETKAIRLLMDDQLTPSMLETMELSPAMRDALKATLQSPKRFIKTSDPDVYKDLLEQVQSISQ